MTPSAPPRRHRVVGVVALLALVAAACGTRLGDEAFVTAGSAAAIPANGAIQGDLGAVGGDGPGADGAASAPDEVATGEPQGSAAVPGATSSPDDASGPGSGTASPGGGGGGEPAAPGPARPNFASDQGVTATSVKVGNISAVGGPLGPETFSGPFHGARAFFLELNSRGGVNGRRVEFLTCDDQENPERNKACARNFVNEQKVFALVGNATDAHASAEITDSAGIPDVGSEPIGSEYYRWPTLYSIYGAEGYARDGKGYGEDGKVYVQTGQYRYMKEKLGITKAAVIYYAAPAIARQAGDFVVSGLKAEGIDVVYTPNNGAGRNPADPNFDSDVLGAVRAGAQAIWQTIDIAGFQRLCQSVDRLRATTTAGGQVKVLSGQANIMGNQVGEKFSAPCRNHVYSNTESWPFSDDGHPEAVTFRAAMKRHDPGWTLSQWTFEGWIAAKLFTEAAAAQGADLTRRGVIGWLDSQRRWTGGGVMAGIDWRRDRVPRVPARECIAISKWSDAAARWEPQFDPFLCQSTPWAFYSTN